MPVALPSEFVLSVEVLSTPADLEKVRIAGHPLGDTRDPQRPSDHVRHLLPITSNPGITSGSCAREIKFRSAIDGRTITVSF